jgi:hypothetical protein
MNMETTKERKFANNVYVSTCKYCKKGFIFLSTLNIWTWSHTCKRQADGHVWQEAIWWVTHERQGQGRCDDEGGAWWQGQAPVVSDPQYSLLSGVRLIIRDTCRNQSCCQKSSYPCYVCPEIHGSSFLQQLGNDLGKQNSFRRSLFCLYYIFTLTS